MVGSANANLRTVLCSTLRFAGTVCLDPIPQQQISLYISEMASDAGGYRSDEDDYIPRGVLKTQRRGWQGEEMELEHLRSDKVNPKSTFCAVDKEQFYNHQVGEGYQAKHVIRQPKKDEATTQVQDMTSGLKSVDHSTTKTTTPMSHRSHRHKEKRKRETKRDDDAELKSKKLQTYLKCAGMRSFRREIEKILSSSL